MGRGAAVSCSQGNPPKLRKSHCTATLLKDILQTGLGYRSIVGGDRGELHTEPTITK
ncbi:MAG: hypothetical protein ACFB0G_10775 [Leptolyngbyaceae cyanobacterium]